MIKITWNKLKSILGLSFQLAKTNFKLKNEGSYLGILWYILDPLFMFIVFLLIKNLVGYGIPDYPLYLLLGLIMFNFFKKATGDSVNTINENAGLINLTKIKHEIFVISILLKTIFAHFFELVIFVFIFAFFNVPVINILFYPLIFIFLCLFTLGVSFFLATLGTYINDLVNIWGILIRLLWLATPIFYSARLPLPFNFNPWNPIYYFITVARNLIIYREFPGWEIILAMVGASLLFFAVGLFIFEKSKNNFAERI